MPLFFKEGKCFSLGKFPLWKRGIEGDFLSLSEKKLHQDLGYKRQRLSSVFLRGLASASLDELCQRRIEIERELASFAAAVFDDVERDGLIRFGELPGPLLIFLQH